MLNWSLQDSRIAAGEEATGTLAIPKVADVVTISGKLGDNAKKYQERIVKYAIEESRK